MPNTPASARLANNVLARGEAENRENRDFARDEAKALAILTDAVTDAEADEQTDDSASGFDMVRFL